MAWTKLLIAGFWLEAVLSLCSPAVGNDLLIGNTSSTNPGILRYNGSTGAFVGSFLNQPVFPIAMTYGPDGNLYVATIGLNINRYEGQSGVFLNTFVQDRSGELRSIYDMTFGPDGNLYVLDQQSIRRYNGGTGAFINTWGTSGTSRLLGPGGLTWGADGKLYVSDDRRVKRFDAAGAFLDSFGPTNAFEVPGRLRFGPDGSLWVPGGMLRYNGVTGAATFTGLSGSEVLTGFDGRLYVQQIGCGITRYNGTGDNYLGTFVPCGSGGLDIPRGMVFMVPEPGMGLGFGVVMLALWRRRRLEVGLFSC